MLRAAIEQFGDRNEDEIAYGNLFLYFQVKINGQNEEMLRAAIEQFGDKSVDDISFGKKHNA